MSTPVVAAPSWPETYDRLAGMEGEFTPLQVAALELAPHHSVLDLGAGSGRLTLPIARRVRTVTALDQSATLLASLEADARAAGLANITTRNARWDELEPGRNFPRHDVVVASRFTGAHDLMKLDAAANELVYVILFAGPSTRALHRALVEGVTVPDAEPLVGQAGVASLYNELVTLGIEANVVHVADGFSRWYPDADAAFADFAWLGMPDGSSALLRRNIRRFLREEDNGVRFLFETRSALVWWRK